MDPLRILFLGDLVGEPGRKAVIQHLAEWRSRHQIDFVVANGENAAGGRGITPKIAIDLLRAGVAVITTGDHVWDQADIIDYFSTEPRLLRPINYPEGTPGQGSVVLETDKGPVGVINGQGRAFIQPPLDNPFLVCESEARRLRADGVGPLLLDFHAETTSEKIAMGRLLDGKVSVVVGTHTHVQTADETIFPGGTAYLTDAGMCGPETSVLGRAVESVVWRFQTGLPTRFPVAKGPVIACGLIVSIDPASGRALELSRFRERVDPTKPAEALPEASTGS